MQLSLPPQAAKEDISIPLCASVILKTMYQKYSQKDILTIYLLLKAALRGLHAEHAQNRPSQRQGSIREHRQINSSIDE